MCGIFGIALRPGAKLSEAEFRALLKKLYSLSESRGKESAGLHLYLPGHAQAWTVKSAKPASKLLKSKDFQKALDGALTQGYEGGSTAPNQAIIALAHSRLVTNGQAGLSQNNQPVRSGKVTVIHNGIVVNVEQLWAERKQFVRNAEVDTEILAALLDEAMEHHFDPIQASQNTFAAIRGTASIGWVHAQAAALTLASNTGDLYCAVLPNDEGLVFASERFILENALRVLDGNNHEALAQLIHVSAGSGIYCPLEAGKAAQRFELTSQSVLHLDERPKALEPARQNDLIEQQTTPFAAITTKFDESLLRYNEQTMRDIRRCSCCVLPETFPFIEFDEQGVCNYCAGYKPKYKGVDPETAKAKFIESVQKYRSADGSPDVLVPFSGGRDSCYGLHLIKTEFGLNPITFTYDWGMVTDLARRNIARVCGDLGVPNILVSADIKTKRSNVRKNVSAWLKKPDLGMVPLFMAGDKHFFKIVNDLKRQTGIRLDLWSANPLENTDFKSGFCGVAPDFGKSRVDYLSLSRKIQMAMYYASRFIGNPGYINSSLLDTGKAFLSYYVEPRRDFFFMFNDMVWNEDEVNNTLIGPYDFELSPDSPSSWRIGDGTAPFYNYIYMTARGFTEFDTFRSNQIREGQITREQAMASILAENRPRTMSLKWYLDTIGLDFNTTVTRINELDTLGLHK